MILRVIINVCIIIIIIIIIISIQLNSVLILFIAHNKTQIDVTIIHEKELYKRARRSEAYNGLTLVQININPPSPETGSKTTPAL